MKFQELISEIDTANYENFLKNNLVALHFFSDWHMNCLMNLPIIENLAEEFSDKIFFGNVNIDESEEIAEIHNIKKVPSIIVFKMGKVVEKIEGFNCEDFLRERICDLF